MDHGVGQKTFVGKNSICKLQTNGICHGVEYKTVKTHTAETLENKPQGTMTKCYF